MELPATTTGRPTTCRRSRLDVEGPPASAGPIETETIAATRSWSGGVTLSGVLSTESDSRVLEGDSRCVGESPYPPPPEAFPVHQMHCAASCRLYDESH